MKTDLKPLRFFGPLSESDADSMAQALLDDKRFYEALVGYLAGDHEGQELLYILQSRCEVIDEFNTENAKENRGL